MGPPNIVSSFINCLFHEEYLSSLSIIWSHDHIFIIYASSSGSLEVSFVCTMLTSFFKFIYLDF